MHSAHSNRWSSTVVRGADLTLARACHLRVCARAYLFVRALGETGLTDSQTFNSIQAFGMDELWRWARQTQLHSEDSRPQPQQQLSAGRRLASSPLLLPPVLGQGTI